MVLVKIRHVKVQSPRNLRRGPLLVSSQLGNGEKATENGEVTDPGWGGVVYGVTGRTGEKPPSQEGREVQEDLIGW